jgi:ferritin-like metal-binding protein YciE
MTKIKTSKMKGAYNLKVIGDLRELLIEGLKDIYWVEKALLKALPQIAKNAADPQLKTALDDHLAETALHVSRLENIFNLLGEGIRAKKCEAMEALINEARDTITRTEPGPVRDAGMISACQRIEHYEISCYGVLLSFSKILDEVSRQRL